MYFVSAIVHKLGIARSTLLYYERIGLVRPSRHPANGYRQYSAHDLNQLVLLRQLQKAGFTLQECQALLQGRLDEQIIRQRLLSLERELREMELAREVLCALYGKVSGRPFEGGDSRQRLCEWHTQFEKHSAEAHVEWLRQLGFSEKEAIQIRYVSRSMADNGSYMEHFFAVFEKMERQGPGSPEATLRAFAAIPHREQIARILDIGCGKGAASLTLAGACKAKITALDNHPPFLDYVKSAADRQGCSDRLETVNASMFALPYPDASFDLLWAEGSAYILGFEKALCEWERLLRPGGCLFVSDAVLLADQPSPECSAFWKTEYPAISTMAERCRLAESLGYKVLDAFILPRRDWTVFYQDMQRQLDAAVEQYGPQQAYEDIQKEIDICTRYGDEFSYLCLLLQKA